MATPTVYVICDQNCKFEGMTKEQILTAIMQAVTEGEIKDVDVGFVQTIKTINGKSLKFFLGEQGEYEELTAEEKDGLFAIITNDPTQVNFTEAFKELKDGLKDGSFVVKKAENAENATKATQDANGKVIHETYATREELTRIDLPLTVAKAAYALDAKNAQTATIANKATQDGSGWNIAQTYRRKDQAAVAVLPYSIDNPSIYNSEIDLSTYMGNKTTDDVLAISGVVQFKRAENGTVVEDTEISFGSFAINNGNYGKIFCINDFMLSTGKIVEIVLALTEKRIFKKTIFRVWDLQTHAERTDCYLYTLKELNIHYK